MASRTIVRVAPPLPCVIYDGEKGGRCGKPASVALVAELSAPMMPAGVEMLIQPMCEVCRIPTLANYAPDDLITMTEASELLKVSVKTVSSRVSRGQITAWPDPDEPNPQKRNRVSRAEVLGERNNHETT